MFSILDVYLSILATMELITVESGRGIVFAQVKLIDVDLHAMKE